MGKLVILLFLSCNLAVANDVNEITGSFNTETDFESREVVDELSDFTFSHVNGGPRREIASVDVDEVIHSVNEITGSFE